MVSEVIRPGAGWDDIIADLALTPAGHRDLVGFDEAARLLACDVGTIEDIVEAGLPVADGRVDMWDVQNVGLYSETGRTRPELEMAAFVRATGVDPSRWVEPQHWKLILGAACPVSVLCDGDWELPDVKASWSSEPSTSNHREWRAIARATGEPRPFDNDEIRAVFDDVVANLRFQYTSASLVGNNERTRERRAGTCTSIASVLAAELSSRGFEPELRYGLLMGLFTASLHCWVELDGASGLDRGSGRIILDPTMAIVATSFFPEASHAELTDYFFGSRSNRVVELPTYATPSMGPEDRLTIRHHCGGTWSNVMASVRIAPVASEPLRPGARSDPDVRGSS